ncbi:hypothetical protein C8R48DRAFT_735315, partial [Suillus tomentosus]
MLTETRCHRDEPVHSEISFLAWCGFIASFVFDFAPFHPIKNLECRTAVYLARSYRHTPLTFPTRSPVFAAVVVVLYDWVLTLGQEIELIWRRRWSLMSVLYLIVMSVFWVCLIYSVFHFADRRHTENMPSVSLTDA